MKEHKQLLGVGLPFVSGYSRRTTSRRRGTLGAGSSFSFMVRGENYTQKSLNTCAEKSFSTQNHGRRKINKPSTKTGWLRAKSGQVDKSALTERNYPFFYDQLGIAWLVFYRLSDKQTVLGSKIAASEENQTFPFRRIRFSFLDNAHFSWRRF